MRFRKRRATCRRFFLFEADQKLLCLSVVLRGLTRFLATEFTQNTVLDGNGNPVLRP